MQQAENIEEAENVSIIFQKDNGILFQQKEFKSWEIILQLD